LVDGICAERGIPPSSIYEVVFVGNTVMHHMLLGMETRHLTISPFEPTTKRTLRLEADRLGLSVNPRGVVTAPPIIDVFVGSDAVADVVSTRLHRSSVTACSCASGPAFEGFHIEHGMKAITGAIEGVRIGEGGHAIEYDVVGGVDPVGICGSGIVDAVAQMLDAGVIDRMGKLRKDAPKVKSVGGSKRFIVAESRETGRDITISERDINEVILAKAAIQAAYTVLLRMRGIDTGDLERVLVGGAFGNHLNVVSAKTLGLLPRVENRKIVFVGNSALAGAETMLRSRKYLRTAERISREVKYLELATSNEFQSEFVKSLLLKSLKN
jgi:uncharacterized 2Fe-2S/4Fe-4S cluster protein (DUF4445 family)